MRKIAVIVMCVIMVAWMTVPVGATTVLLSDTFNRENGGEFSLDYKGFKKWVVVSGSVDLLDNHGEGGYPATLDGLYVELDGTRDGGLFGGIMVSRDKFLLTPGTYRIRFSLGNSRDKDNVNVMTISVGDSYNETFMRRGQVPFRTIVRTFHVDREERSRIMLENPLRSDKVGILMDNIKFERLQ